MTHPNTPTGLATLVKAVVASYQRDPGTSHIGAASLPSRDAVVEIIRLLRELLFPGYFGKQDLREDALEYHVGDNLAILYDRLFEQVRSAFRHQAFRAGLPEEDAAQQAATVVSGVLGAIPAIRALLATDVQAAFEGDPAAISLDEIIFSYPGLLAVTVHRIAHELHRRGCP